MYICMVKCILMYILVCTCMYRVKRDMVVSSPAHIVGRHGVCVEWSCHVYKDILVYIVSTYKDISIYIFNYTLICIRVCACMCRVGCMYACMRMYAQVGVRTSS